MKIRALFFLIVCCLSTVDIAAPDNEAVAALIAGKFFASKKSENSRLMDQENKKKILYLAHPYAVSQYAASAYQKRITTLKKNIDDTHDDIMNYIYLFLLLREAELLDGNGNVDFLDLADLMILYSRKDKKEKKEAKKEAKREAKEAKREARESKRSSLDQPKSNSQSNSYESQQRSCDSSPQSSSQNSSQNSSDSSAQAATSQQSTHSVNTTNASTSDTSNNDGGIKVHMSSDTMYVGTANLTPSVFGDFKFDPTQEAADSAKGNDKNKSFEKPTPPSFEEKRKDKEKTSYGIQTSLGNSHMNNPYPNSSKMNELLQKYDEDCYERFLQKCSQAGYDNNVSSQQDELRQKAYEEAVREVNNEYKQAHEQQKAEKAAQEAAELAKKKEKKEKNAADKKEKKAEGKQKKQEYKDSLAADRSLGERIADRLLWRTPRKKEISSPPSGPQSDIQDSSDDQTIDENTPTDGGQSNDMNSNSTPPSSSSNQSDGQQDSQNSGDNSSGLDNNSPHNLSDNDDNKNNKPSDSHQHDDRDSQSDNGPQKPENQTPSTQSYWDYAWSFVPSFNGPHDLDSHGNPSYKNTSDNYQHSKYQVPQLIGDKIRDDIASKHDKALTQEQREKIDKLVEVLEQATNNMTVELAQGSLQSMLDAFSAESDKERAEYQAQSDALYDHATNDTPQKSQAEQPHAVTQNDIDSLMHEYTTSLTAYDPKFATPFDTVHMQRLEKRQKALAQSSEQLKSNKLQQSSYYVSPDVRGFMMANQINYTAFDSMKGTSFQHCLLQENLKIVEFSVGMQTGHVYESIIHDFIKQSCNTAVSAQQLNQLGYIKQAAAVTDINHMYNMYRETVYDLDYEMQACKKIGAGVYKGVDRVVGKVLELGKNFYNKPSQTLGEIADNFRVTGDNLLHVCSSAQTHSASAYMSDYVYDFYDLITTGKLEDKSRAQIRSEQNAAKISKISSSIIANAHDVINTMAQQSMEDNVADLTEFSLNRMVQAKIMNGVASLSQFIGKELVGMASEIKSSIPPHLLGKRAKMVPGNSGKLIAIVDGTGEQIAVSMKASGKSLSSGPKNSLKSGGKSLKKGKVASRNKPSSASIPVKGSAEWKKAYPHGEFKPSPKHHINSSGNISKPPVDGQACLNKSLGIKNYPHRIAIEEGNIVVLRKTSEGVLHGYICPWDDVPTELQKVLREGKLVHPKTGKIL